MVKDKLERSENPRVDFSVSILKSKLCAWLFQAWEHVKNMDNMICKGWEKTRLLRSFNE
jgi:hypothetical protein